MMKKTLATLLAMASSFPALGTEMDWQFNAYDGGASYAAGTTVGELTLEEVMTTGSPSSHSDILSGASGTNITGGELLRRRLYPFSVA